MVFHEADVGGASHTYASLGGDATVEFSNGSRLTHSHTASFQHFTQAVTTVAGGIAIANVSKAKTASDNALAATKDTNATSVLNTTTKTNGAITIGAQKANLKEFTTAVGAGATPSVGTVTPIAPP